MLIEVWDKKLVIKFPFKQQIVDVIKRVPGRIFDPKYKRWTIPVEHVVMTVELLAPLGFNYGKDIKDLLAKNKEHTEKIELIKITPAKYEGSLPLYDFQKIGAAWMKAMDHCLLGDVPGLGKTIQTIAASEKIKNILVLCPASLKYSWQEEIKKWEKSMSAQVIDGNSEQRAARWNGASQYKWTIANYELLLYDYEVIPKNWDVIVCDEAQRISNPDAKSVRALKTLNAKKKIALSGTPISNSPLDIFGIVDWLKPGFLGNIYQFKNEYCVEVVMNGYKKLVGYKNLDALALKIAPLMLRRTKDEVLTDFPPKVIQDIVFDLSDSELKLYEGVRTLLIRELGEQLNKIDARSLNILPVKMLRLKQVTGHPLLIGKNEEISTKLNVLEELLEKIVDSGDKAIVFTQFAEMAKLMEKYFEMQNNKFNTASVYGDKSAIERDVEVQRFSKDSKCKVMIMTEAGAFGLNLQAASYVIHYDMPWSIAKLTQREDRAHRIGQTKPVTVYNLIARNTIDEYVAKVLSKKQRISVDILQDEDRLEAAGVSEEDIKAILRL